MYCNPVDEVPDYASMNPLVLHLTFVSEIPEEDRDRLMHAGAVCLKDDILADGSRLIMLRDPWGLAIQL